MELARETAREIGAIGSGLGMVMCEVVLKRGIPVARGVGPR
jgi:hypothetical protein